jgi:serine/threonine protein kinase
MIGKDLGPYRVLERVGAGGMGEVYRARDAKLNRDVAIKILPQALAADPLALARFEREAQAVAALSHPNILAIHDFGREGETAYAVMELLEGETLRARLAHGALPSRKAVELAVQIAEGLAAAHEKGIVHRDLKPENVFVTGDGRAKVLDFGLAKRADSASSPSLSMLATGGHTGPGMVLGTPAYMSPEQVRGEPVDHRSDIFSFGAVLHEMLTGRQAFGRETATESMTAILKEDPPEIATTSSGASPGLQRIVQHCLEKKPGERFQSMRDIAFALQALSGSGITSGPVARVRRRVRLDIDTGRRVGLGEFMPADPSGISGVQEIQVSADGRSYSYNYVRRLSDLYLVEGLR